MFDVFLCCRLWEADGVSLPARNQVWRVAGGPTCWDCDTTGPPKNRKFLKVARAARVKDYDR